MDYVLKTKNIVDDGESEFEGTITVDMPPHHERQKFAVEMGVSDYAGLKANEIPAKEKIIGMAEMQAKASEKVYGFVKSCDLRNAAGEQVKTKEELWCHPELNSMVDALIAKFLMNFNSEKKKPLPKST